MDAKSHFITRDALNDKLVQKLVRERGADHSILSDEDLLASRRALIPDDYRGDIWVFGYGSLLWNPVIQISKKYLGRIYGYHRRFCLKTEVGRGAPGNPGLVLGLDYSGSCVGMALKVAGDDVIHELDLLWRREMINASYQPRFVRFHAPEISCQAIAFVINRQHTSYFAERCLMEKTRMIATASGFAGSARDYLIETRQALRDLGIKDRYIEAIYQAVIAYPHSVGY